MNGVQGPRPTALQLLVQLPLAAAGALALLCLLAAVADNWHG